MNRRPARNIPRTGEFLAKPQEVARNRMAAPVGVALQRALANDGKLPSGVLNMPGMSGLKYRIFINNLIETLRDARYLEVGVWMGSTLCSAIHGNKVTAVAIDDWSQFGGPKAEFLANVSRFSTPGASVTVIESDFRAVDFSALGRFNVYLFDGPHEAEDQREGIIRALPALDDQFVLVVDDWNWAKVRDGTIAAIRDAGLTVDYVADLRTTLAEKHELVPGAQGDWHNGYFIAALSKSGTRT